MEKDIDKGQNTNSSGFNWGKGIAIVFVLFVVATLSIVGFIMGLDYHMVTENHYQKAENYQQHIERIEQTGSLEKPVEITFLQQEQLIQIRFPDKFTEEEGLRGSVELYRPSDSSKDKVLELRLNPSGLQSISGRDLEKGKWIVKVTWNSSSGSFYQERSIFL